MEQIVFLDLETTGTSTATDRIVEIACIKMQRDNPSCTWQYGHQFYTLVNPRVPIPDAASAVHGITDFHVLSAPFFSDIAKDLLSFINGCMLGGFNSDRFDIPLLVEEFLRIGVNPPRMKTVDAMRLFHKKEPRNLNEASKMYLGREIENAHSAMSDVLATADVFIAQQSKYDVSSIDKYIAEYEDRDVEKLDYAGQVVRNKEGVIVFNFGKEKGKPVMSDSGKGFAEWCLKKDFITMDTKNIIESVLEGRIS